MSHCRHYPLFNKKIRLSSSPSALVTFTSVQDIDFAFINSLRNTIAFLFCTQKNNSSVIAFDISVSPTRAVSGQTDHSSAHPKQTTADTIYTVYYNTGTCWLVVVMWVFFKKNFILSSKSICA